MAGLDDRSQAAVTLAVSGMGRFGRAAATAIESISRFAKAVFQARQLDLARAGKGCFPPETPRAFGLKGDKGWTLGWLDGVGRPHYRSGDKLVRQAMDGKVGLSGRSRGPHAGWHLKPNLPARMSERKRLNQGILPQEGERTFYKNHRAGQKTIAAYRRARKEW